MQSACDRSCTVVLLWSPTLNPKIGIPDCFEVVRDRIIFLGAVCLLVCSLFFLFLFHFRFWFFVCSLVCLYAIEGLLFVWRVDIFLNFQMVGPRLQVFFLFLFSCWGCVNLVRKQIQCDSIYFCEQTASPDHCFFISKIVRWVGCRSSKRGLSQICLEDREESRQNHFLFFLGVVCLLVCSLFFLSFSF